MNRKLMLAALFLVSILCASAQTAQRNSIKLSYDGYYHTLGDSLSPFKYYLRFYDDGTVIGVTTAGNPNNLLPWFKKEHNTVAKGKYVLADSTLQFSMKSEQGEVAYTGVILKNNRLFLSVKSLINKYLGKEEYYFMKMDGLK